MSIWTGIKHALNSTLGTNDFKSLDKMILGMRSLQASDNVYMTLEGFSSKNIQAGTTEIISHKQSITPYSSGSLKLKIYYKIQKFNTDVLDADFTVYINGSYVNNKKLEASTTSDIRDATLQISYQAGDIITLAVSIKSGQGPDRIDFSSSKVEILGTLTEYNALNIKNL